jgi:hypothetical protein
MAAAELTAIAEEVAHSERGRKLEQLLQRLSRLDPELADELIAAITDFDLEHVRLVAVSFFKAGQATGAAKARQPRDHRPGHSHRLQ